MLESTTRGRFSVGWTPGNGLVVDLDGVPLVRSSTFYIVKAGWAGVLFNQSSAAWSTTGWSRSARASTARFSARTADAEVEWWITVTDDAVSTEVSFALLRDVPAEVEYAAAYLSAPVLTGPWRSNTAQGVLAVAPPEPGRTQGENRLGSAWRKMTFSSPRGDIDLRWSGTAGEPVTFDARSDAQGWAKAWPVLWTGLGSPPKPLRFADGRRSARLQINAGPAPDRQPEVPTFHWSPRPRFVAQLVEPPPPILLPTPKRRVDRPGVFRLRPDTPVVAAADAPSTRRLLAVLEALIGSPPRRVDRPPTTGPCIVLGDPNLAPPPNPEGYVLQATPNRISLSGRDPAGLGWAVETFTQLATADSAGPLLHCTRIDDWPSLAFRGVHLFHGKDALPFHRKLIDRVLAPGKLNRLLIQCEQVRWNADPTVAPTWAGTPDQIREECAFARSRGIAVHPLVQGYGHMEWLFSKPANRNFAEDPETPYAVHFEDPGARGYLERFIEEANAVFSAGATHVGLDEVTMRGRFPYRSAGRGFSELFATAAKHWRDFLAARGAETWMWADMLLHPTEVAPCFGTAPTPEDARAVRSALPKDIVLFDWQYEPRPRYPSLDLLRREGFGRRVAATWFDPEGIRSFAAAAVANDAWGALQTTWCGYESKEAVLETSERRQFTAMVAAAEHFWNGGATRLPEDAGERFARVWRDNGRATIAPAQGHVLVPPADRRDPAL
ncbi:MAG: glycoside hydrolase family 20 zincin-like fold domain-containing protein, partial [Armatimonadota bacterium]